MRTFTHWPLPLFLLSMTVIAIATACSEQDPPQSTFDERVLRCLKDSEKLGYRWRDGECRDQDGEIVEPGP